MSREKSIGLTVIGVLLVIFSGLLIRRFATANGVTQPEQLASAEQTGDKPSRTVRSFEPGPSAARRLPATSESIATDRDQAKLEPRFSGPTAEPAVDRYGRRRQVEDTHDNGVRAEGAVRNPFAAESTATVSTDEVIEREPAPEPGAASPLSKRRTRAPEGIRLGEEPQMAGPRLNPVRRTSAEEPLDVPDNEAEPAIGQSLEENTSEVPSLAPPPEEEIIEPTPRAPLGREIATPVEPIEETPAEEQPAEEQPIAEPVAAPTRPPFRTLGTEPRQVAEERQVANVEPSYPENGKYTVQPNDTLWSVSEKVYGTGRYFKAIAEHNRSTLPRPGQLAVGTVISVPPVNELEQRYPALCPKQRKSALVKPRTVQASTRQRMGRGDVYVVEEGDTLFDIARHELGKASRWAEIYELNRDTLGEDFDYLQPGTELAMPQRAATDAVTRQPGNGLR